MYMSQPTYEKLNDFLQKCFQMNSYCDNLAYNMSNLNMINAEKLFHTKFAHAFPEFADTISDMMVKLDAQPQRQALNANTEYYGDFKTLFNDLKEHVNQYRLEIFGVIEEADINGDLEVKVTMEQFLYQFVTYLNQASTWYKQSKEYGSLIDFDRDFASFTFI